MLDSAVHAGKHVDVDADVGAESNEGVDADAESGLKDAAARQVVPGGIARGSESGNVSVSASANARVGEGAGGLFLDVRGLPVELVALLRFGFALVVGAVAVVVAAAALVFVVDVEVEACTIDGVDAGVA